MPGHHNARIAVLTCTPMATVTGPMGNMIYDPISPLWHRARMGLCFGTNINTTEVCIDGLEVGDARSRVAARCLEMNPRPFCLLFIDSDVIVPNDAFTKLFYHLKAKPHIDVAAGVYVVKGTPPYDPLVYQENGMGAFWDFAIGDMLTTKQHNIRAVHMGLTLIRVDLLQRMKDAGLVHGDGTDQDDEPFFCTQRYNKDNPKGGIERFAGTEDIYFFHKARQLTPECQILVDTSVLGGHHDKSTGITYGIPGNTTPVERAMWMPLPDGSGRRKDRKLADENTEDCNKCILVQACHYDTHANLQPPPNGKVYRQYCLACNGTGIIKVPLKLAIDLGAGESRREWPGYKTYTLDARKDSGCDYCQELGGGPINLPSQHFDLVATRHVVEHIGRWDQEDFWAEMFRITKPGGKHEHVIPNLLWAAEKIVAGEIDTHTLNVIYGGQEADTTINSREFNSHHMGFTPEIAAAIAESCGLVNIEIKTYKDDPDLIYHMKLTAERPLVTEEATNDKPSRISEDEGAFFTPKRNGDDNAGVLVGVGEGSGERNTACDSERT